MKKIVVVMLVALLCTGCFKRDSFEDINVYTSVYPTYYVMNALYSDSSTINSIYPNGIDGADYELNDKQLTDYSKADLFVYNGLSKEANYAYEMLQKNNKIRLIDSTMGIDYSYSIEELWLDPSNMIMMARNISNGLFEYIENPYLKKEIENKYENLKLQISKLDVEMQLAAANSSNKTLVVNDDAFLYLRKYGLTVISLEENDNLTPKVIHDATVALNNGSAKYIYINQNLELSETVKGIIAQTNKETVALSTLSYLSLDELANNDDYFTIMYSNIDKLKQGL